MQEKFSKKRLFSVDDSRIFGIMSIWEMRDKWLTGQAERATDTLYTTMERLSETTWHLISASPLCVRFDP